MEGLLPGDTRHPPIGWAWTSNSNQNIPLFTFLYSMLCKVAWSNLEQPQKVMQKYVPTTLLLPDITSSWHCDQRRCLGALQPPARGWSLSTALSCMVRYGLIWSDSLQTSSDPINQHLLSICSRFSSEHPTITTSGLKEVIASISLTDKPMALGSCQSNLSWAEPVNHDNVIEDTFISKRFQKHVVNWCDIFIFCSWVSFGCLGCHENHRLTFWLVTKHKSPWCKPEKSILETWGWSPHRKGCVWCWWQWHCSPARSPPQHVQLHHPSWRTMTWRPRICQNPSETKINELRHTTSIS